MREKNTPYCISSRLWLATVLVWTHVWMDCSPRITLQNRAGCPHHHTHNITLTSKRPWNYDDNFSTHVLCCAVQTTQRVTEPFKF